MGLAALCVLSGLAACSPGDPLDDPFAHYNQRILTVAPTAGSAVAANEAIQTIDPWPRYVYNTRIPGDGARMTNAFEKYENTGAAAASGSAPVTINTGTVNTTNAPTP
jgi:hypothetical protein